jgi:hypothetical protein
MSPVRAPSSILVDDITGPVSRIEPALSVDSIHAAIAATTHLSSDMVGWLLDCRAADLRVLWV